jgi:hypothetical protein
LDPRDSKQHEAATNCIMMNVINTIRTIWTNQGQDGQDTENARKKIGILIKNVIFVEYREGHVLVGTPTYKRENKES